MIEKHQLVQLLNPKCNINLVKFRVQKSDKSFNRKKKSVLKNQKVKVEKKKQWKKRGKFKRENCTVQSAGP
jgi:hypothetical protein